MCGIAEDISALKSKLLVTVGVGHGGFHQSYHCVYGPCAVPDALIEIDICFACSSCAVIYIHIHKKGYY